MGFIQKKRTDGFVGICSFLETSAVHVWYASAQLGAVVFHIVKRLGERAKHGTIPAHE